MTIVTHPAFHSTLRGTDLYTEDKSEPRLSLILLHPDRNQVNREGRDKWDTQLKSQRGSQRPEEKDPSSTGHKTQCIFAKEGRPNQKAASLKSWCCRENNVKSKAEHLMTTATTFASCFLLFKLLSKPLSCLVLVGF